MRPRVFFVLLSFPELWMQYYKEGMRRWGSKSIMALLLPLEPDLDLGRRMSEPQPHLWFLLLYAKTVVVPGNSACLEHNTHTHPFSQSSSALERGLLDPARETHAFQWYRGHFGIFLGNPGFPESWWSHHAHRHEGTPDQYLIVPHLSNWWPKYWMLLRVYLQGCGCFWKTLRDNSPSLTSVTCYRDLLNLVCQGYDKLSTMAILHNSLPHSATRHKTAPAR